MASDGWKWDNGRGSFNASTRDYYVQSYCEQYVNDQIDVEQLERYLDWCFGLNEPDPKPAPKQVRIWGPPLKNWPEEC